MWGEERRIVLDFNLGAFDWHFLGVGIFLLTPRIRLGFGTPAQITFDATDGDLTGLKGLSGLSY